MLELDRITLAAAAVAGTVLTQQVYLSDASLFATCACGVLALTNIAWILRALRRDRAQQTVVCLSLRCEAQATPTCAEHADQADLSALAVDDTRHGATA